MTWGPSIVRTAGPKPRPRVLTKRQKAALKASNKIKSCAIVRKRDGGKCRACGKPGNQAHHVVYRSHGGKDEPRNLIYVCTGCHQAIHAKVLLVSFDPKRPAQSIVFTRNRQWDKETETR